MACVLRPHGRNFNLELVPRQANQVAFATVRASCFYA